MSAPANSFCPPPPLLIAGATAAVVAVAAAACAIGAPVARPAIPALSLAAVDAGGGGVAPGASMTLAAKSAVNWRIVSELTKVIIGLFYLRPIFARLSMPSGL